MTPSTRLRRFVHEGSLALFALCSTSSADFASDTRENVGLTDHIWSLEELVGLLEPRSEGVAA